MIKLINYQLCHHHPNLFQPPGGNGRWGRHFYLGLAPCLSKASSWRTLGRSTVGWTLTITWMCWSWYIYEMVQLCWSLNWFHGTHDGRGFIIGMMFRNRFHRLCLGEPWRPIRRGGGWSQRRTHSPGCWRSCPPSSQIGWSPATQ